LYLLLCFYILPAFAAVLKTRSKKLAQVSTNSNNTVEIANAEKFNDLILTQPIFFNNLSLKFNNILFSRNNTTNQINSYYNYFFCKSEAHCKLYLLLLNKLRIVVFFI